jgi:cyclopropane-fatty-acyl-phospholipid synthase
MLESTETLPSNATALTLAAPSFPDLPGEVQRRFSRGGLLALGDDYIRGLWEAEPLENFLYELIVSGRPGPGKLNWRLLFQYLHQRISNRQSGTGVFEVAERHYDLGNDLFSAMLDTSMSYTCGYWRSNVSSLAEAQEAKLQRICEKLELSPGMTVLDIGCGWGNFAEYAARNYGVKVTGLTISKEQAHFAAARCTGLPVHIHLRDYREVHEKYDRIVSIEMIEAVGKLNIRTFFDCAARQLEDGGRFVVQAISAPSFSFHSSAFGDQYLIWLEKHIFPNGYLPSIHELMAPCGEHFRLENVEQFGSHYEKTLKAWEHNVEQAWPGLRGKYGEEFRRMWRFYLCGCMAFFRAEMVQLYQLVYVKQRF